MTGPEDREDWARIVRAVVELRRECQAHGLRPPALSELELLVAGQARAAFGVTGTDRSGQERPTSAEALADPPPTVDVPTATPSLYTVPEVARLLKVSERTVSRHIKAGDLRAVKAGRSTRIHPDDLDAYLDDRTAP